MADPTQFAHALEVPLNADSVDSPIVNYGGNLTCINFTTQDGRWGRVTFERLDSIKVSRGEYEPFPPAPGQEDAFHWVNTISNSSWLKERYQYEKKHYENCYNFGGSVEEMLTDFSHYLFSFHDQFVEAIAAGIWFESGDSMLGQGDLKPDHPLRGLRHITSSERLDAYGITCQVRRNPLSDDELERRARLCSQTVIEVAAELDGRIGGTSWSLTRRVRNGVGNSHLRDYFGNPVAAYSHIPTLSEVRPVIDKWLAEVRERRRQMGKA
jgi:hypothetical protein